MTFKRGEDSLKRQIRMFLKENAGRWVNGGTFERMALDAGFKASNADRRLRELCEEYADSPYGVKGEERPGKYASSMWYCYRLNEYERLHAQKQAA